MQSYSKLSSATVSSAPTRPSLRGAAAMASLAVWLLGAPVALAQQGVQGEQLPPVKGAAAQKGGAGGDSAGLRQRVEQLEGQIVDLQVVIGTLESLARTGGAQPAPVRSEASGGMAASDRVRLDSIETQIRALTAQVEQLAGEVRAQGAAPRRSDLTVPGPGFGEMETDRFGSTTVTSDGFEPPPGAQAPGGSQMPGPPPTYGAESLPPPPGGDQFAAADPMAGGGGSAKEVYETAYGHLLQQNYGAAEAGFRAFLKSYPQDALAPNALYWLGESHYVQRNYQDAAEAFDLVVQAYAASGKAPDAQLKRGMSLAHLGKRQDACAALRAVGSKFPSAPPLLKNKAEGERQRIGCP